MLKSRWIRVLALLAALIFGASDAVHAAQQAVQPKPGAAGQWRLIGQTHAAEFGMKLDTTGAQR
jgi:hypothetical protein